jgi:leader peptidase (prepilin peptidase)/N-methyltransferase
MPSGELLEPMLHGTGAYLLAFVLGILFGSFANVCIYRLPAGLSIVTPRSRCGQCSTPIRWYDNLPIASWVLLRGRCRTCGAGFSPRYLLVEAACGMLFVAVYYLAVDLYLIEQPAPVRLARFGIWAAFVVVLVIIAFIDLDTKLVLDKITYPAIPGFYLLGLALPERTWWDGLLGAAVGYGGVRLISDGYYWITKREGLGYGDGKLLAIVGALHGWPGVVVALFAGSLVGSLIGIPLVLLQRRRAPPPGDGEAAVALRHAELPFGPFLVAGAIAYLFLHPWLEVGFRIWGVSELG